MVKDYKPRVKVRSSKKRRSHINNVLRFSIWVTLCASITMMVLCAVIYVSTAEVFHVNFIHIKKTPHLTEDEVLSMLGLDQGDNIFSWDMTLARQRLEAHPWAKAVKIKRRFIPASVSVEIEEYVPVACVIIGDKRYLISKEGKIFVSAPRDFSGLVIRGGECVAFDTDQGRALLKEGIKAVRYLEHRGVLVKDMNFGRGERIEIGLSSGVCMGFWGDVDISRIDRALVVMRKISLGHRTLIDLSFDDKVILRFTGKGA